MTAFTSAAGRGAATAFGPSFLAVLLLAAVARWLAYSGFFGSDEVTYTDSAFKLLDGDWRVDDYVGANRLGVNFPVAGFAALLGRTEIGAAAYSLLCSLGEVALVAWAGRRLMDSRAGLFAGLLMASLPTHVHFAGRLMADAPLCLAITAAFVLFYEGERGRKSLWFFLAGVCAGLSFWVKPVTLFVFGVFLAYPAVVRRFDPRWLWMVVGMAVAMAANGLLFWCLTGNFWFIIDAMRERRASGYLEVGAAAGEVTSAPLFYVAYLFGRIYHTGLLGYLAAAGALLIFLRRPPFGSAAHFGLRYALFWALGLLLIMSVLPVSLRPVMLIPKQTNYMLIFMAPLCLLGGWALSRAPRAWSAPLAVLSVLVGFVFALLLQSSVAVFTANSRETLRYVKAHPGFQFLVMSNAQRAGQFEHLVGGEDLRDRLLPIKRWADGPAAAERRAIVDGESFSWDGSRPFATPQDVPACWTRVDTLRGDPQGLGIALLHALDAIVRAAPGASDSAIARRLQALAVPKPAQVYRVPAQGC